MLQDILELFNAMRTGPLARLETTNHKGLIVSTVLTPDMGYETAVLDSVAAHPVERYEFREDALAGHRRWVETLQSGQRTITRLGYGDSVPAEEITLVPIERDR